jgi:hypothetical protein
MNEDENGLIEGLKALTSTGPFLAPCQSEYEGVKQQANPPVTQEDLLQAEKLLGYALPPLLQRIYLEVGNGGFGPGYGLVPLFTPEQEDEYFFRSIVHTTLHERGKYWPETLLFICDWGCFITSSIDVSLPGCPIVRSEQGQHWGIEAPSLYHWLRAWLDGKPLFYGYENLPPVTFPW